MATDRELLKKAQAGHVGSAGLSDPKTEVGKANRFRVTYRKGSADTNAADNTAELCFGRLDVKAKLVEAKYTADANVAASNANAITLIVAVRDGAGGSAANIATVNTANANGGGTGSLVLFQPVTITRVAANADSCAAGSVCTLTITKANSGVVLAAGLLDCVFEAI